MRHRPCEALNLRSHLNSTALQGSEFLPYRAQGTKTAETPKSYIKLVAMLLPRSNGKYAKAKLEKCKGKDQDPKPSILTLYPKT